MHLHTYPPTRLSDRDWARRLYVDPPSYQCSQHAEYYALRRAERSATREIERLGWMVATMIENGEEAGAKLHHIQRDLELARWYLEALDKERAARELLRARFFTPRDDTHGE